MNKKQASSHWFVVALGYWASDADKTKALAKLAKYVACCSGVRKLKIEAFLHHIEGPDRDYQFNTFTGMPIGVEVLSREHIDILNRKGDYKTFEG